MSNRRTDRPALDVFAVVDSDERVVCGYLLAFYPETSAEFGAQLDARLFQSAVGMTVFGAISALAARNGHVDTINVTNELRDRGELDAVGGPYEVSRLVTEFTAVLSTMPVAVAHALDRMRQARSRRLALESTAFLTDLIHNPSIDGADLAAAFRHQGERIQECQEGRRRGELPEIEDLAGLWAEEVPEPPEVVEGLLHQGAKMVVGGGSKSFKTWLLTDLGLSVAAGARWMGFATVPGNVLYINLEIQRAFFRQRSLAIGKAKSIRVQDGTIQVWNLRGFAADLATLLPRLLKGIGDKVFSLIIVDPIYKVTGGRDENAAGDMTALLNELERLAVETGAAVVFGAHFSKGNQAAKESIDRIGGSGVYARDPDTILVLTKHEEDDAFTVETTLRNHAPVEPFVVRWQYPLMHRDEALDPANLKKPGGAPRKFSEDDLIKILGKDSLTMKEWQERAAEPHNGKVSAATFYRLSQSLKKAGRVKTSPLNPKVWFAV